MDLAPTPAHLQSSDPDPSQPAIEPLLARCAARDQDAWRQLVNRYARRLYALAYSRTKDPVLAEEIAQSVLATVATTLTQGTYAEQGRFEPWLFRIAMNRLRDHARRAAHQRTHRAPGDPDAALQHLAAAPASQPSIDPDPKLASLRNAVESLNDQERELIELRHHAGLEFKAIAELLNEPLGTLLARHHRALKKLRTILESASSTTEANP